MQPFIALPPLSLSGIFAQNLLVARLTLDRTQQALAHASGVSRATIAQIEAGTGDPKLSTIQQLAEAFGVSPVLLLLGKIELVALSRVGVYAHAISDIHATTVTTMLHLVSSGLFRSRLEAAYMGVAIARHEGLTDGTDGAAVGAAIGSFHLPGAGTLTAARMATLLTTSAPVAVVQNVASV